MIASDKSISQTRAGLFAIGGRSTAVKLPNNDVFLYVSTPHSPATAATIAKMGGPVKYLVTPDGEHGMYMEEYTKAYPEAKCVYRTPSSRGG